MSRDSKGVFILLGMPGVGKGTQAQLLADTYKLYHIDTGQSLRTEISLDSELGRTARNYMEQGQLVPFELVIQVIKAALMRIPADKQGYLFDGFPRNIEQAHGLKTILDELSLSTDAVLYLETPHEILMDRLAYRVSCAKCDAKYNLKLNPPKDPKACDACAGELVTRKDDRPEVIENRLNAYQTETSPLIAHYEGQSLLHRVNADQEIETVFGEIQRVMDPFLSSSVSA